MRPKRTRKYVDRTCVRCSTPYTTRADSGSRFCSPVCFYEGQTVQDGTDRRCTQCGELKPAAAFAPRADRPSGRMSYCKACKAQRVRVRYQGNHPTARAQMRSRVNNSEYERSDRRKESYRIYRQSHPEVTIRAVNKYRFNNPEKVAAHKAVTSAVKRGHLLREPCRECGNERSEGHHYLGYAPEHHLDVLWLCRAHHREAHSF